jgi:hypothetical protein
MNGVEVVLWFGPVVLALAGWLVVRWAKRH